jgi:hypothetical protein
MTTEEEIMRKLLLLVGLALLFLITTAGVTRDWRQELEAGITREKAEQLMHKKLKKEKLTSYQLVGKLAYAQPVCVGQPRWVGLFVNSDSAVVLVYVPEFSAPVTFEKYRNYPGYAANLRAFLDEEQAARQIREHGHDSASIPELFFCNAFCIVDCMGTGALFYRFYDMATGEEFFLLETGSILPANSYRKDFFELVKGFNKAMQLQKEKEKEKER